MVDNIFTKLGDTYRLDDGTEIKFIEISIAWPAGTPVVVVEANGVSQGYLTPANIIALWPDLWWQLPARLVG